MLDQLQPPRPSGLGTKIVRPPCSTKANPGAAVASITGSGVSVACGVGVRVGSGVSVGSGVGVFDGVKVNVGSGVSETMIGGGVNGGNRFSSEWGFCHKKAK